MTHGSVFCVFISLFGYKGHYDDGREKVQKQETALEGPFDRSPERDMTLTINLRETRAFGIASGKLHSLRPEGEADIDKNK